MSLKRKLVFKTFTDSCTYFLLLPFHFHEVLYIYSSGYCHIYIFQYFTYNKYYCLFFRKKCIQIFIHMKKLLLLILFVISILANLHEEEAKFFDRPITINHKKVTSTFKYSYIHFLMFLCQLCDPK